MTDEVQEQQEQQQEQQQQETQQSQEQQQQEQQTKETVIPDELNLTPIEVDATGNAVLDQVGALLKEKQITNANKIIKDFVQDGEISLADQAALVDKLGEATAKLVMDQLNGEAEKQQATATAERGRLMEYACDRFGDSKDDADKVWAAIQDFAKSEESGFSDDDRKAMNKMLQAGGLQAEMTIDRIATVYEKSAGYVREGDFLTGDSPTTSGFQPISRQDYVEQMREAVSKYGDNSRQVQEIRNKREASIKRGY